MARPREFDEEQALLAAMQVFWRKGYDGASIPDLLQATGLSRSSLYETFGDKAALFEAAARLYFRQNGEQRIAAMRSAASTRDGLRRFFDAQIRACLDKDSPRGCLLTNTATSLESHDPRIVQMVAESTQALRKEFLALLERGQRCGEIAPGRDLEALSQMLLGVSFGMNVMARVNPARKALQAVADSAIEAVG